MNVLALDLATNTGWARMFNGVLKTGSFNLLTPENPQPTKSPVIYWDSAVAHVSSLCDECDGKPTLVIERSFHRGAASRYLNGLTVAVELFAYKRRFRYVFVPSATWRKRAREMANRHGYGWDLPASATKADYHMAALRFRPSIQGGDEADAWWMLQWYLNVENESPVVLGGKE